MAVETERTQELDDSLNVAVEPQKIVAKVLSWLDESEPAHKAWLKEMEEDFRFYDGEQWDQDDAQKLREEGRPALTLNRIKPQIDLAAGIQEEQKLDIKVIGRSKDDTPIADALSQLIKYVCDQNDFDMLQSDLFLEGIICGRGWLSIEQDFDDDWINGKTLIRTVDPSEVRIPRRRERDLSDCDWILRVKSLPKEKIKQLWPEASERLQAAFDIANAKSSSAPSAFPDYGRASDAKTVSTNEKPYASDSVDIIEAQWKEWGVKKFLVDPATRDIRPISDDRAAEEAINTVPGLKIISKRVPKLYYARVCEGILLEYGPSPYDDNYFWLVPFFAYRGRTKDYGIVKNLKDPQREVNKRRSQILHVINTSANAGWITDDEGLAEQLEVNSSTPGFVAITKPGSRYERVAPPPMPVGILRMEEEAMDDMKAISGINSDLLGIREATQSGIAIDLRIRQGLTIVGRVFANFRYALKQATKIIISRIRQYMPPDEIARILGPEADPNVVMKIKSQEALKYDVIISQSPSTPSIRISNFMMMMELKKSGVPIPDDILIEVSDLPQKQRIIERIQQAQTAQTPGQGEGPPTQGIPWPQGFPIPGQQAPAAPGPA